MKAEQYLLFLSTLTVALFLPILPLLSVWEDIEVVWLRLNTLGTLPQEELNSRLLYLCLGWLLLAVTLVANTLAQQARSKKNKK